MRGGRQTLWNYVIFLTDNGKNKRREAVGRTQLPRDVTDDARRKEGVSKINH